MKYFNLFDYDLEIMSRLNGDMAITKYLGKDKVIYVPDDVCGKKILEITKNSFQDNKYIKIIVLSKNVRTIAIEAFRNTKDVVLYTPYSKKELSFEQIENVTVRYQMEKLLNIDDVYYACFLNKKAYIFDQNINLGKLQVEENEKFSLELESYIDDEYAVEGIESNAFINGDNIKEIGLPKNLIWIGSRAFSNCLSLKSLKVPQSVVNIGSNAFSNCVSLKTIELNEPLYYIGDNCFLNVHEASILVRGYPKWKTHWNPEALPVFYGYFKTKIHDSIIYAILESNTAVIIGNILSDSYELKIPEYIEYIESKYYVTTITGYAFKNSRYLKNIQLPNSLKNILGYAFESSNIEEVIIPDNVILSNGVFYDCIYLQEVVLPKDISEIPKSCFYNCRSLKNICLPDSIKIIHKSAFKFCSQLAHVDFPFDLEEINDSAFYGTDLTFINIGENVKFVAEYAFGENDFIKTLVIDSTNVKLNKNFITNQNRITIYLNAPLGSDFEQELREIISSDHYIIVDEFQLFEVDGVIYILFELNVGRAIGYHSKRIDENTIINNNIGDCIITSFEPYLFRNCKKLITCTFPDSITSLKSKIFVGCSNLKKVIFPHYIVEDEAKWIVSNEGVEIVIEEE